VLARLLGVAGSTRPRVLTAGVALLMPAALLAVMGLAADAPGDRVQIIRTAYGIPHVVAPSWADLGYGEGYALAQDDLCVFANDVVTLSAQRARWFGPGQHVADSAAGGLDTTNLDSDFFYAGLNASGVVPRLLAGRGGSAAPSRTSQQMVAGYAAGYDAYLAQVGGPAGITDPACRGARWVRPVTALDIWRRLYQLTLLATSVSYLPSLVSAAPPASAAAATTSDRTLPGLAARAAGQAGSNAWGLGVRASRGGSALLLANPHFPWSGPERFWEVGLTIPGQLNVEGASLPGVPGVLIGFNQGVAWSFTVSAARPAAIYELSLVPGEPTEYHFGRQVLHLSARKVTVEVPGPRLGRPAQRSKVLWSSRFGPMIAAAPGLTWTRTQAFSLYDPNAANLRLMDTVLGIDTSRSVRSLDGTLRRYEGLPWLNTVAADSSGRALFADISVIPHLADLQLATCLTGTGIRRQVPLPVLLGSGPSCLPGRDADSAAPGIFGGSELPGLVTTQYVANSNDGPWQADPAHPLTGYPLMTADTRSPLSLRSRLGLEMIRERIAGTDGLPGTGFDLADLEADMLNDRNYAAQLVLRDLVGVCQRQPTARAPGGTVINLKPACQVLARWDGRDGLTDRGAVLFHEFLGLALTGSTVPFFADPFSAAQPLTTPGTLNTANPELGPALAGAVLRLRRAQIPISAAWGSVQYVTAGGRRIPIPGSDSDGDFNIVDSALNPAAHGFPGIASGVTFLLAVEYTRNGPQAGAILAYSESANVTSPHAADQTELYSRSRWVRLPYSLSQVSADAKSSQALYP
jgi:acyl-homoserine-lactone acylase